MRGIHFTILELTINIKHYFSKFPISYLLVFKWKTNYKDADVSDDVRLF